MTNQTKCKRSIWNLLRDERGAILIITTVYLPVIVGFFSLAVDMSYVLRTRNTLQVTAEAAALAATSQLPDPATSCTIAKNYATINMPVGKYGNVLRQNSTDCSDVVLGKWPQNCPPGTNCFSPLPGGSDCISFQCNAAQVTTRMAQSNGNTLQLAFAPMIGLTTQDVSATAIAVFGSNSLPWDLAIVQDVSGSFTNVLSKARAADQGLLNCMNANAPAGSRLGITTFSIPGQVYQSPSGVSANYDSLKTKINGIQQCGTGTGQLPCNGTDIAAGINAQLGEYNNVPNPAGNSQRSIVLVTDGLPNHCNGASCSTQQAQDAAEAAADAAWQQGISIYTIYYCSSGSCDSSARNWLASLVRGTGQALVTPDPNKLSTLLGQVCASQPHRLVW